MVNKHTTLDEILLEFWVGYYIDFDAINNKFDRGVITFDEHQERTNEARSEALSAAKQAINNYINSRVIIAKQQMKANVFMQFKVAMTAQDLSARPLEGARFRTPLEELSLILEHEAPLSELNQVKGE